MDQAVTGDVYRTRTSPSIRLARAGWRVLLYVFVIATALMYTIPFLWMLGVAFRTSSDLYADPARILPDQWTLHGVQAVLDQLPFAHTSFFTNQAMERLAFELIENAPAGIARVYFCCGGSEAVEAALKLARQYFVEIGQAHSCSLRLRGASSAFRLE